MTAAKLGSLSRLSNVDEESATPVQDGAPVARVLHSLHVLSRYSRSGLRPAGRITAGVRSKGHGEACKNGQVICANGVWANGPDLQLASICRRKKEFAVKSGGRQIN